ncbi:hypothetical protein D3C81_1922480 [compost metagenome]
MEAVEQHAEARVIGLTHDVPDLLISIHVTAPRQRFVTNAQAARAGMLGQQAQIID